MPPAALHDGQEVHGRCPGNVGGVVFEEDVQHLSHAVQSGRRSVDALTCTLLDLHILMLHTYKVVAKHCCRRVQKIGGGLKGSVLPVCHA